MAAYRDTADRERILADIRWKGEQKDRMSIHQQDGVVWLSWPAFDREEEFVHGFSTRLGGVSTGDLSEMNLSFSRGDDPDSVMENFSRISRAIGFSPEQMVFSSQTHTANVRRVGRQDCGNGLRRVHIPPLREEVCESPLRQDGTLPAEEPFADVDGLITDEPGVILTTFYADCVPLFFIDPVRRAAGLSHSGWRGTVSQIGAVTVREMERCFGSRPADLLAAIGPSICRDCYEVSEEVADAFREIFTAREMAEICTPGNRPGKYQLDLWQANRLILIRSGIPGEHISMPGLCTCCNPSLLFSHRASHGRRGNLAGFLGLRAQDPLLT